MATDQHPIDAMTSMEVVDYPRTLGFELHYRAEKHRMSFLVLRHVSQDVDTGAFQYDSDDDFLGTPDRRASRWHMHGFIRWDGCIDLDIGAGQSFRSHFCGLHDALQIAHLIRAIFDLASRKIAAWSPEYAE